MAALMVEMRVALMAALLVLLLELALHSSKQKQI